MVSSEGWTVADVDEETRSVRSPEWTAWDCWAGVTAAIAVGEVVARRSERFVRTKENEEK